MEKKEDETILSSRPSHKLKKRNDKDITPESPKRGHSNYRRDNNTEKITPRPSEKKKKSELELEPIEDHINFLPPVWSVESFSEEKRQKIKSFRESRAAPYLPQKAHDLEIARWLIARKWDLEASVKMYIDSAIWREKENIDNIFEWIPKMKTFKFLSDYWPNSILPEKSGEFRTHDGYLIIYEKLCAITPHILQAVSLQDLRNFHIYIQELTTRERKRICQEKNPDQYAPVVYVQDLEDLTVSHLTRQNYSMMNSFTDIDSFNYPETIRKVFIINAPSAFTVGWKISQKFLDPATIDKISILGTEFKSELLKAIPPSSLPVEYGGTLQYKIRGGGSFKEVKTLLPKLFNQEIYVEVFSATLFIEQGVQISWRWRTKNDIMFGVFYQSNKDTPREIVQDVTKHEPEGHLVEGLLVADKPGLYTLSWDNTGSWIKRKLKYLIFLDGVVVGDKEISLASSSKK